jgi:hypothetical protein
MAFEKEFENIREWIARKTRWDGEINVEITEAGEKEVIDEIKKDPKAFLMGNIDDIISEYEETHDKRVMVLDLFALDEIMSEQGYRAIDVLLFGAKKEGK